MTVFHSHALKEKAKETYKLHDIIEIETFLREHHTLNFPANAAGLFPAAITNTKTDYTGYQNIWIRDNIHIAFAHYRAGNFEVAQRNILTLAQYFIQHKNRFNNIIQGKSDPQDPMNRPHIRFDGLTLKEIPEKWPHAQNDALGYFLWFYCKLATEKHIPSSSINYTIITSFVYYWQTIKYWEDSDSGHWEEVRKINTSSIGAVCAALTMALLLLPEAPNEIDGSPKQKLENTIIKILEKGKEALQTTLPHECKTAPNARLYDAALLFLIFPLEIVNQETEDKIIANTITHLQGDHGIRRYAGDSYWAPDYKDFLKPKERCGDFSATTQSRDSLLKIKGTEAQWCIFDSALSTIYGRRYKQTKDELHLLRQVEYFNRAIGQIFEKDGKLLCPEAYYLEHGQYVPNDNTPLLWAQANLWGAITSLKESLRR